MTLLPIMSVVVVVALAVVVAAVVAVAVAVAVVPLHRNSCPYCCRLLDLIALLRSKPVCF